MEQKFIKLEDIARTIDESWTITEKARRAYLTLGQNCFYNTSFNYLFGGPEVEIFGEADMFGRPNIGVCKKFTNQYLMLLKMLGIKCTDIKTEADEFGIYHPDASFIDESGEDHIANITADLSRIQTNSSTQYFADGTISKDKLRQIDLKIGYITPERTYTNEYFSEVRQYMKAYDLSESERVDMMFKLLPRLFDLSKLGDDEQAKALRYVMREVFCCTNSYLHRCFDRKACEENYYIKSFNEARRGVAPHTTYLLFNKQSCEYEPVDQGVLLERGMIRDTQKYY